MNVKDRKLQGRVIILKSESPLLHLC